METLPNLPPGAPGHLSENFSLNGSLPSVVLSENILMTLGVVMVVENVISMILLYKCTRLAFQIQTLSLNLAVSDLLTGATFVIPNSLFLEKYQCDINKYPTLLFINVSLLIVTLMNLDRCFVFAFTMRYFSFITKKLLVKLCCLSWFLGLVLTYGMFFSYENKYGISCEPMAFFTKDIINTCFKCILLGFICFNFVMFGYLLHHILNRISRVNIVGTTLPSREGSRMVKKISVVTGVFLAVYFPFLMIITFPILDQSKEIGRQVHSIFATLVLLNSACNPVFYLWRFSEPRYHMKKFFCFWNKRAIEKIDKKYNEQNASYKISVQTGSL